MLLDHGFHMNERLAPQAAVEASDFLFLKNNHASHSCVEAIIARALDIAARIPTAAALTNKNRASINLLAAEGFHSEALSG